MCPSCFRTRFLDEIASEFKTCVVGLSDCSRERIDPGYLCVGEGMTAQFEHAALLGGSAIANVDRCRQETRRWFDKIRSAVECQRHSGGVRTSIHRGWEAKSARWWSWSSVAETATATIEITARIVVHRETRLGRASASYLAITSPPESA